MLEPVTYTPRTPTLADALEELKRAWADIAPAPQPAAIQMPAAEQQQPVWAQLLQSAMRPATPSFMPRVKGKASISPEDIAGFANVQALQHRAALQQREQESAERINEANLAMARRRMALDQAKLEKELSEPGAREQALLGLAGKIIGGQYEDALLADRTAAMAQLQAELGEQAAVAQHEREQPYKQSLIDYYRAMAAAAGASKSQGEDGTMMTPKGIAYAVQVGAITPKQGQALMQRLGYVEAPSPEDVDAERAAQLRQQDLDQLKLWADTIKAGGASPALVTEFQKKMAKVFAGRELTEEELSSGSVSTGYDPELLKAIRFLLTGNVRDMLPPDIQDRATDLTRQGLGMPEPDSGFELVDDGKGGLTYRKKKQ